MKDKNGKEVHVFDKVKNDIGTVFEITFIPEEPSEKAKEWMATCELVEDCEPLGISQWLKKYGV